MLLCTQKKEKKLLFFLFFFQLLLCTKKKKKYFKVADLGNAWKFGIIIDCVNTFAHSISRAPKCWEWGLVYAFLLCPIVASCSLQLRKLLVLLKVNLFKSYFFMFSKCLFVFPFSIVSYGYFAFCILTTILSFDILKLIDSLMSKLLATFSLYTLKECVMYYIWYFCLSEAKVVYF